MIFIKCFKNSKLVSRPNRFSVRPSYLYSLGKIAEMSKFQLWLQIILKLVKFVCHVVKEFWYKMYILKIIKISLFLSINVQLDLQFSHISVLPFNVKIQKVTFACRFVKKFEFWVKIPYGSIYWSVKFFYKTKWSF